MGRAGKNRRDAVVGSSSTTGSGGSEDEVIDM